MLSVEASHLLKKYGTRLVVTEQFILGNLRDDEQYLALEITSGVLVEVARIRLKAKGLLNKENVH